MCLNVQTGRPKSLKKEHGYYVGWKVYYQENCNKMVPQYKGQPQDIGKWLNEKKYRNSKTKYLYYSGEPGRYPVGFHLFIDREDAANSVLYFQDIRKIYFRDIITFGFQNNTVVVVAKSIKILRKRNYVGSKSKKRISKKC